MKKSLILTVLLAGLLFYGCGSKGGTAASSNGSNSSSTTGGAAFALNMVDSNNAQNVASKITITGTPPAPSNVRVVIRSMVTVTTTVVTCPGGYDDFGVCSGPTGTQDVGIPTEVYRDIQDVLYSGSTVTIGIPQGTGYTLDVITYSDETTNKSILKYGRVTNVDIPNTTNSATVIMNAVADILQMTVASDVLPNQTFSVTVNNVMPFALSYKMIMSFGTTTVQKIAAAKTTTFTAPVTYDSGQTVALQGQFVLDRSCLKTGESSASWTRLFPNPAYSEDVYSNLTPLVVVSLPNL